jgi:ABC-type dipeptide/oligopeptide/nickel transport system permease component
MARTELDEQKAALLGDAEFRRALSIALNRQAIIDAELKGVGRPAQIGPSPGLPWHDPEHLAANAEYDPTKAREILDDLGLTQRDQDGYRMLPSGDRLSLTMIARPGDTGPYQFMVEDWAEVGLRVILQEKPHRLFLASARYADLQAAGDQSSSELSWGALGAGAPYWGWYYDGGMHGTEESKAAEMAQPDALEIHAMRLGQQAAETFDMDVRFQAAREVMRIAREQVWTINVATPQPLVAVVKDTLRGIPDTLLHSFMMGSSNNSFPEAWYWENPETLNGVHEAPAAYLQEREASILQEIQHTRARPTRGQEAVTKVLETEPGGLYDLLGRILKWAFIGIAIAGVGLVFGRHPFVLRRVLVMVPTLVVISIIVYSGVQLPEGSYLDTVLENLERSGQRAQAEQELAQLREMYHLDDSGVKNYFRWTGMLWFTSFEDADKGILQGNLGRSMAHDGAFVNDLVGDRFLMTFSISLGTILLTWLVAIPIGVYSAVRQYSIGDYVLTVLGFLGMCIPQFVLALVMMLLAKELFDVTIMGLFSPRYAMQEFWDLPKVLDLLKHIWLPIFVVGATGTAGMIRVMRANLLDELKKPYVITAMAKGVRPVKLLFKYPFRLALNPFISGIGGIFPQLISGSAIVAIILSLPTIGPLLLNAVRLDDTYMAGSLLLLVSALSVFGVLVSDLLLMLLDPRIRMEGQAK